MGAKMSFKHYFKPGELITSGPKIKHQMAVFYRAKDFQISIYNTLINNKDALEICVDDFQSEERKLNIQNYFKDDYTLYSESFQFIKLTDHDGFILQLIGVKEPRTELVQRFQTTIIETIDKINFHNSFLYELITEISNEEN
jgi:hypothetical protein